MIISCEKCSKKFEISENLIPDEGRLLECGSCSYQWHYMPINRIKLTNEVKTTEISAKTKKISHKKNKIKKKEIEDPEKIEVKDEKKVGFLSYLIVFVISFIALLVVVETFKSFIISFIPNIDFYLSSLYESLKDIFLFFKDLIK